MRQEKALSFLTFRVDLSESRSKMYHARKQLHSFTDCVPDLFTAGRFCDKSLATNLIPDLQSCPFERFEWLLQQHSTAQRNQAKLVPVFHHMQRLKQDNRRFMKSNACMTHYVGKQQCF